MLTEKHIEDVCLVFHGERQCRYLLDEQSANGVKWVCRKKSSEKYLIDEEVELNRATRKSPIPSGDNCDGYLPLKEVPQGYDLE